MCGLNAVMLQIVTDAIVLAVLAKCLNMQGDDVEK